MLRGENQMGYIHVSYEQKLRIKKLHDTKKYIEWGVMITLIIAVLVISFTAFPGGIG